MQASTTSTARRGRLANPQTSTTTKSPSLPLAAAARWLPTTGTARGRVGALQLGAAARGKTKAKARKPAPGVTAAATKTKRGTTARTTLVRAAPPTRAETSRTEARAFRSLKCARAASLALGERGAARAPRRSTNARSLGIIFRVAALY